MFSKSIFLGKWLAIAAALCASAGFGLNGCGSGSQGGAPPMASAGQAGTGAQAGAAAVQGSSLACVISADCAAGYHCDLGECLQACSEAKACSGGLVCSPRGECAATATPEPLSTARAGTLTVEPLSVPLTERDTSFEITLSTDAVNPVNYRIELSGAHLGLSPLRGSFTKTKKLTLAVNANLAKERRVLGSVRIFSDLGNANVEAPLRVGLTGRYQGVMRYDGGLVSMGDARLSVELLEKAGNVSAKVDPKESMLFPLQGAQFVTGVGFKSADELTLSFDQRIEKALGGKRNLLGRDVGRRVRLILSPANRTDFAGTFEETLFGLFVQPVKVTGSVTLRYSPDAADPDFVLGPPVTMPVGAVTWLSAKDAFGGIWGCPSILDIACTPSWINNKPACFESVKTNSYKLDQAMKAPGRSFKALVSECSNGLSTCALIPNLGCAAQQSATLSSSDLPNAAAFGRLIRRLADPGLLIANDLMVDALRDSLNKDNLNSELTRYDLATERLSPAIKWIVQPGVLDYLERLTPEGAKGDAAEPSFPAVRTLSKLLKLLSSVERERSRLSALVNRTNLAAEIQNAQERSLLSYLEAASLLHLIDTWQVALPDIAIQVAGLLTPLDGALRSLTEGASTFGIPDGFVPFVWQPSDLTKGGTNFEQMAKVAATSLEAVTVAETEFTANARQFDNDQQLLQAELQGVTANYDTQLKGICGTSFAPDAVKTDADWSKCGVDGAGELAILQGQIEQAVRRTGASFGRLQGMKDKVGIDEEALAQKQGVRRETLRFIDNAGQRLEKLTIFEGAINVAQKVLDLAANANLFNLGAPVGMSIGAGILEAQRTTINVQRQGIQTAQTMRFEQQGASLELIDGMANIQRQMIDINQVALEIQQDVLLVLESQLRLRNTLDQAKLMLNNRAQALSLIASSPINDPSFRLLRDKGAIKLLNARAQAQRMLLLMGRALEYEINTPLTAMGGAVINARNQSSLGSVNSCFTNIFNEYVIAFGSPQAYSTTVSAREMLGIKGSIVDAADGRMLSPGEQFRQLALRNDNLDSQGGLSLTFSTNLQPGNQLWSSDVCGDRITDVQAQLVGDFLGNNEAQVNVALAGAAVLRTCDTNELRSWSLGKGTSLEGGAVAVLQSGVNTFGEAPPNQSLAGQSVARSNWQVAVPGSASAPSNKDVDLTKLEDIVLKVQHRALPKRMSSFNVDISCLMIGQ